jgi:predicted nucleic-acid-binding Zn-ribbon protein
VRCKACGSVNHSEFDAEMNVHFPGLKNLVKPPVMVFPKLLVCLACGFTEFALTESELLLLATKSDRPAISRP